RRSRGRKEESRPGEEDPLEHRALLIRSAERAGEHRRRCEQCERAEHEAQPPSCAPHAKKKFQRGDFRAEVELPKIFGDGWRNSLQATFQPRCHVAILLARGATPYLSGLELIGRERPTWTEEANTILS